MATATASSQVALYKRMYPKGVQDQLYKKSPALADCKKKTDFGGEGAYINIMTSGTGGGSADFPTALANQNPTTQKRFFVTHKTEYQVASVTGKAIATSMNDKMSVLRVLKTEMDKANYKFSLALSSRIHGNAGGSIGQISAGSTVSSATITLAVPSDVAKFEIGDWVQTSVDNGTGTSPAGVTSGASGNQIQITGVNRTTGTLTVATTWDTIGAVASYYLFRSGDYANAMTGYGGYNPVTAPTSGDSFFGMDRSVGDLVRQAGDRYSGNSGGSYEDTLLNAGEQVSRQVTMLPRTYVGTSDFNKLVKEVGSKRIIDTNTREAGIGFKGISVYTSAGVTEVTPDVFFPNGYGRMVNPDDMTLATAGECPNPLNWGGSQSQQILANADALQFRIGCYGEFMFEQENCPIVITF